MVKARNQEKKYLDLKTSGVKSRLEGRELRSGDNLDRVTRVSGELSHKVGGNQEGNCGRYMWSQSEIYTKRLEV